MYAIFETGGKQYRVEVNDTVDIELVEANSENEVKFDKVLLLNDDNKIQIGSPFVEKCVVKGKLMQEVKGDKVIAYKYKRRKNYRRKVGHRQKYSRIKITEIKTEYGT